MRGMGTNGPLHGMTPQDMMKMLGPVSSVERRQRVVARGRKKLQDALRERETRRAVARSRLSAFRQYVLKQPRVRDAELKALINKADNLYKKHSRGHMEYRKKILNILGKKNDRTNYMKSLLRHIRAHKSEYRAQLNVANREGIWNTWRGIIANSYERTPTPPRVSVPYVRRPSPAPSTGRTTPFPTIRTKENRNRFFRNIGKVKNV